MVVYVDNYHRVRVEYKEGYKSVTLPCFDGKCKDFIENHIFLFEGETLVDDGGEVLEGEMLFPCKEASLLEALQRKYEKHLVSIYEESLRTVGVVL